MICSPTSKGELGIKQAKLMEEVFLSRQAQNIMNLPNSLVARIPKVKYHKSNAFEVVKDKPSDSWLQKGIFLVKDIYNLGKDVQICNWNDC